MPGFGLSERGRRQAAAAADQLAERDIGSVWASPLERAQETAAAIASRHGLEITTDERLIESGTTLEGVGRTLMAFLRSPRTWWAIRNPWKPSWGETYAEIRTRMVAAIQDAAEQAGGREVVVVSHQAPVLVARQALSKRAGPPWRGGPCTTGSVTSLVIEDGAVVSASYFAPEV